MNVIAFTFLRLASILKQQSRPKMRLRLFAKNFASNAARAVRLFNSDDRGNIAIIFAISSIMLVTAAGAGMDLSRGYLARQKLSQVAALACQYATRPDVIQTSLASYSGSNGGTTYVSQVNSFITKTLQGQNFILTQTTSSPFTYTQNGAADVSLTASVPTNFMQIANVTTIPISARTHCYDTPASVIQRVPNGNSVYVVQEGFENTAGCSWGSGTGSGCSFTFYSTNGSVIPAGTAVSVHNSFTNSVGYTGANGTQWYIMGYCVEVDYVGVTKSTVVEGTHLAELDCDNGSGNSGNSSMSAKVYLPAGKYELRYNFTSRELYTNYYPIYICGSAASDISWANDTSVDWFASVPRTNQINTYLDLNTTGQPPTHLTSDGTQTLGGSNLIDVCVDSNAWVERSVAITVTTPGYYWLSFAADGTNDSYGGLIDNIRLCVVSCPGTVQDNFPASWANKLLFEDTFDSPIVLPSQVNGYFNSTSSLNSSYGTTSTGTGGWPRQSAVNWATTPYNSIDYLVKNSAQGTQSLELDANKSSGETTSNRSIHRPFYLVPGYYRLDYNYVSDAIFPSVSGQSCLNAPTSSFGNYGYTGLLAANNRFGGSLGNYANDTNSVAVFMSNGQLVSTPIGGGSWDTATKYNNPSGTVTTTPTYAPDTLNISTYNATQNNPVLDYCGYSSTWMSRTSYIKIVKPGAYWLTIAAKGTADNVGSAIDDVKLTALNSLYGTVPSNAVTIPVPSPQPGSTTNFTGFSIISNPLTP